MRKTIKSLEERITVLEQRNHIQEARIIMLEEQVKFYRDNTHLIITGTTSLERMNDVMAHVITDMKWVRTKPDERR